MRASTPGPYSEPCPLCQGGGGKAKLHLSVTTRGRQRGLLYHLVGPHRILCANPKANLITATGPWAGQSEEPDESLEAPAAEWEHGYMPPGNRVAGAFLLAATVLGAVVMPIAISMGKPIYCVPSGAIFLAGLFGCLFLGGRDGRTE